MDLKLICIGDENDVLYNSVYFYIIILWSFVIFIEFVNYVILDEIVNENI